MPVADFDPNPWEAGDCHKLKASAQDPLIARQTFTLKLADIQALKRQLVLQSKPPISTLSSFVAIAAHFWVCLVKSKVRSNKNEATSLWLLVDLRSHFSSISSENDAFFTGNCIRGIQAKSTCKDLTGPNGLASACVAITQAVQTVREEPMKGVDNWPEEFKNRPIGMSFMVAGSTRYGAYNVDFGWGKPGRVELVSMNYDGEVSMLAGQEKGSVQATVGLAHEHIEMFSNAFMTGFFNGEILKAINKKKKIFASCITLFRQM
ncbi:hypothetical protein LUZ60_014439 [Juncus effusus]|nr:hypothetical protein LUZ60_014439 [Juncus effusus]